MLTNTSKYAIRACIYLAIHSEDQKKIGIKKISEDLGIPTPFLGKILQALAKHKLLASSKGPNGGFSLGKKPSEITMLTIVKIIDGDEIFTNCLLTDRLCEEDKEHCPVQDKYANVREEFSRMFGTQNLQELADCVKNNKAKILL